MKNKSFVAFVQEMKCIVLKYKNGQKLNVMTKILGWHHLCTFGQTNLFLFVSLFTSLFVLLYISLSLTNAPHISLFINLSHSIPFSIYISFSIHLFKFLSHLQLCFTIFLFHCLSHLQLCFTIFLFHCLSLLLSLCYSIIFFLYPIHNI